MTPRQTSPPGAPPAHLPYRPAIDGLRAVAVLSVVLYHFGVPGLPGGFMGVDVFFVISGYLIGGILWSELQTTGRIALGRFYMRRVRRLAPAYLAMATATGIAAWIVLLPFEFREFGKTLIAATLWLSNVQFWREAGYFDVAAEAKVLLHTWSLSVEEQFYVVLPVTLLALGLLRRWAVPVLAALWAVSLGACLWLTPSDPVSTFYLFPFRAWELLTGVILAIAMRGQMRPVPTWVSGAGIALIVAAVLFGRSAGFPGWQAMVPVVGTALVLANTGDGAVNRVLAHPAPVFVGLISYSLYLWHWPVLTLSRIWRDGYDGPAEAAWWFALVVALSIASWALVERPLRRAGTTRVLLGGTVGAAVALLGLGAVAYLGDGLPARFPPAVRMHVAASQDFLQDWSRCGVPDDGPYAGIGMCAIGPEGPTQVIVWGDSHLRALMDGLARAADEAATPGIIFWHAGCPPMFGVTKAERAATPAEDAACARDTERLRQAFTRQASATRILLVGRWAYYATGTGSGTDLDNAITLTGDGTTQADIYARALTATVAELSAEFDSVWILRQVPEIASYDSRAVASGLAHGRMSPAEAAARSVASPEALAARVMSAEAPLYDLAAAGRVRMIDTWPPLCPDSCTALLDGRPVYFDNNHLTNAGALALRGLFMPFLTGAGS